MRKQLELIQAIRGIAALLVVYFHTSHAPKFGAFGVDIFFVLSGCVMAMLMSQGPTGRAFLWRRLARIFPLYFLATTVAYAVSCLLPATRTSGNIPSFLDYLKSVAFVPHQALNGEIVPVLGVGWTLNYEMAFYLCCAAACTISIRSRTLWATLAVALLALISRQFAGDCDAARFYANPIIAEFVAGLAVWHLAARFTIPSSGSWALALIPCLVVAMAWAEWANFSPIASVGEWDRPSRYLLPAAVIVFCALMAESAYGLVAAPARRALVLLGDASYAIYLTHVFVIGAYGIICTKLGLPVASSAVGAVIAVAASVVIGALVHRHVELPVQGALRRTQLT